MGQSESSDVRNLEDQSGDQEIVLPKRTFTVEFAVGFFTMIALAAAAYLSVGLGGLEIGGSDKYYLYGEFDNISGLEPGASVEIAGVKIGDVVDIVFVDPVALVKMKINRSIKIREDDIASIRTKGIIGDRYVKINRGGSDNYVAENGKIVETESVIDIEDLIGKIVHNFSGGE